MSCTICFELFQEEITIVTTYLRFFRRWAFKTLLLSLVEKSNWRCTGKETAKPNYCMYIVCIALAVF